MLGITFQLKCRADVIGHATTIAGGQWAINRSVPLLAELGFDRQKSQMINLIQRF